MSELDTRQTKAPDQEKTHSGHGWMMMICCVPMLVIAIVLVATGVAGVGFIFVAIMCTAMMAMMMQMMMPGDRDKR
jgi:Flp pilus assembly protein TadB